MEAAYAKHIIPRIPIKNNLLIRNEHLSCRSMRIPNWQYIYIC